MKVIDADRESEWQFVNSAVMLDPSKVPADQLPQAREMIERAMHVLDLQLAQIRQDLGVSDKERATSGRWWAKATAAQRIKGKQRQRLQTLFAAVNLRIRERRKELNDTQQVSREKRFIQLAKAHLSKEIFLEIWRTIDAEESADV